MSKTFSILIIEDEVFLREIYTHSFEKRGFKVTTASDGNEGIQLAESGKFDLILLDIMMPGKHGLEVLQTLKKKTSPAYKTPIILLTNLGQEAAITKAKKLGAEGFLIKVNLIPRELINRVEQFLNGSHNPDDLFPRF